ncbi:guanine deaminase [Pseudomonas cavernae]|uniref:Guanine deaminase n=1 Tax=Pseudomonas cavernae TaxID=2320867 RepID=A0A385Z6P3_9PSED|nr:guanine deaminase [Pseudomonas cavernae]AYC34454.1 guanine deaminase [Pseudomonas cavernae]
MSKISALRADVVTFKDDPFLKKPEDCLVHIPDAIVVIDDGKIVDLGPAAEVSKRLPAGVTPVHYPDSIISAGFIDTHIHYPQTEMIGAFGEQLLEWLDKYTFVAEQHFANQAHAERVARVFLRELLRAGTTTAVVYCTVHPQSVDAFFGESSRFNTRMVAGKVLMDRNAPAALLDTAQRGYDESKALIERWHNRGRQHYCITPRFAPTSTQAQLDVCGTLAREHQDAFIQTHLCENLDEIQWVKELFPERKSYLDVYANAGIVRDRSVYGHGVHLTEEDFCTCHQTGAALAHCPTSNLFLGSGLFRLFDAKDPKRPVRVGLGTDVGAGTSFSQLQSLNEAYKVAQLNKTKLNAIQAFYLATRGSAEALCLDQQIGTVAKGFEADLVVLDKKATPLMEFRSEFSKEIVEELFVLMILGDDRAVRATYVAGEQVYDRDASGDRFRYPA